MLGVRKARDVPVNVRGLRNVGRVNPQGERESVSARSCGENAVDLQLLKADDGQSYYCLRKERGLQYTLFRPFNWIGPGLDRTIDAKEHRARSVTQIIYDILHRGEVNLVGGGEQRRSFTWIGDGIDALMLIIRNENGKAD